MKRNLPHPDIRIRPARKEDAKGILDAHYSSVHETASRDYPAEVIEDWSPPVNDERIKKYLLESFPEETTLVAEINGEIAGFGSIVETENELRAVYVSAKSTRMGIGTKLLSELEMVAKSKGCKKLEMVSSITAELFYRHHGYKEVKRGDHTLRTGRKMACVKMRKILA